jgi:transposase
MINKCSSRDYESPTTLTAKEELSAMTIYLYIKTHNKTGLKYLGKTNSKDPYKYKGSGYYWKDHIKKHGYDVTTEILRECSSNEEVKEWGLYYSNLWNVVEEKYSNGRKTWANLKPEYGDGVDSETARKFSLNRVADGVHNWQKRSDGTSLSSDLVKEGKHNLLGGEVTKTQLRAGKHASQITKTCQHCGVVMDSANYAKHHGPMCGVKKPDDYVAHNAGDKHYTRRKEYHDHMVGLNNPKADTKVYTWENTKTGERINLTRYDLSIKLKCHRCNITAVINGYNKTVFGWRLVS